MRTLRKGDAGASVSELQSHLIRKGFGPLSVDGVYGSETERAVLRFQETEDLTADGIVGPATWAELLVLERAKPAGAVLEEAREELRRLARLADLSPDVRTAALLAAIDDLGKREQPNGSNAGPEIEHIVKGYREYWRIYPLNGPALPWCGMAVSEWIRRGYTSTIGREATWGDTPMGARLGGVEQFRAWARSEKRWVSSPEPGAAFVMSRDGSGSDTPETTKAGHIGLVLTVDGDRVRTIEGNTSNAVQSRYRERSTLLGFVRWWG